MNLMAKLQVSSLITPLILISLYIAVVLFLRSIFPTGQALIDYFAGIYGRFGYEIVLIGSFLEALIIVNFFIPGVAAVGLGVIFARAGDLDLTLAIILAVIGALTGYVLNFILGRFGFGQILERLGYKDIIEKTKLEIEKSNLKAFSLGFIHPNIGALVSLSAGILKVDFKFFFILSILSTIVWYIIWGLLIFALGNVFLTILTKYVFILFLLVGAIWLLLNIYRNRKK